MTFATLAIFAAAIGLASPQALTEPKSTGDRVLFLCDVERWDLPISRLTLPAFGWDQDYSSIDFPRAMEASLIEGGTGGLGRAIRIPVGGGSALLISRQIPEPGFDPTDPTHPPVEPGELLVLEATVRWDDLGRGSWEFGVRFSDALDEDTGRPIFGREFRPLLEGGGPPSAWSRHRAEVIVPEGTVAWRLEIRVDAPRERRPGGFEFDDVRVTATPRAVVRWRDPLRRVDPEGVESPVELYSVGLPSGDYEVELAVLDSQGEILAAERLARFVDDPHPIHLRPSARFLGRSADRSIEQEAEIRWLVVRVRDARGHETLLRQEPFALGNPPFAVGRGRSRHGMEVSWPLEEWVRPVAPVPALLAVTDLIDGWPRDLASVPESQRAARIALGAENLEPALPALAGLFRDVSRWYLESAPDVPAVVAALATRAPDLRFGIAGELPGILSDVPQLLTVGRSFDASLPRRFAARLDGVRLGLDPEVWATTLLRLDAAGASEVYLIDPMASLFRRGRTPEEGFAPQASWLVWRFCRGYLGSARCLGRERWLGGAEALLYRREGRGAVVLIADGRAFLARSITLHAEGDPRVFDATGHRLEIPPVENGVVTIELRGRFLLIEGIDLPLERTVRSLAISAADDGFRVTVDNHLGGRATLEPSLELPPGYELRGALTPSAIDAGKRATWDVAIEVPPSAGIEGTEWTHGTLTIRRPDGRSAQVPFQRPIPLESARVVVALADVDAGAVTVRISNREAVPVRFHLYLQAGPDDRGERTYTAEILAAGEGRLYELPFARPAGGGGDLWVGVTFLDGERGYFNRTFSLP